MDVPGSRTGELLAPYAGSTIASRRRSRTTIELFLSTWQPIMPKSDETNIPEPSPHDRTLPPAGDSDSARQSASRPANINRVPSSPASASRTPAVAEQEATTVSTLGNGRRGSPREVRRDIEQTRARMSDTLDALEDRLAYERQELERKKNDLVDRVTLKPVRRALSREPWRSVALAFAAGYIVAAIRD